MFIRMKFIVGVALLVIQLSSISARGLDRASEHSQIDSPTLTLKRVNVKRVGGEKVINKIIVDIKSRRFRRAFKKMNTLKEDIQGTMNYLIHEVYNNNVGNFDLILQFVDDNLNETTSFAIYKALNYEMVLNKHNDRLLRLRLMKSFKGKQFNPRDNSVTKLERELHNLVSNVLEEELKNAAIAKNSTTISTISENIYNNYPEVFNEVIKQALNESFDQINTRYIVKFFMGHKYPEQSICAYSAVLRVLKKRNNLDQSVVVSLAFGIKEALDYASLNYKMRKEGERLRNILPLSTRHLAFDSPLAIVNENGEYLYAASDDYNYDPERRKVFTWLDKVRVTQGKWFVERHGDVYQIKNYRNETHDEYMLRSLIPTAREDTNFVFTWIPGGTDDYAKNQFNWVFEPNGDYVYIRNEYRKEYLFAGGDILYETRRYVYTSPSQKKVDGSLWKIEKYVIT